MEGSSEELYKTEGFIGRRMGKKVIGKRKGLFRWGKLGVYEDDLIFLWGRG